MKELYIVFIISARIKGGNMQNLRKQCLPRGWYPRDSGEINGFLEDLRGEAGARTALAPHAGWYYSGAIAAKAVSSLACGKDWDGTVAVLGGHLPAGMPPLFAMEDGAETPLGNLEIDGELRTLLAGEIGASADRYQDNTVEVLLPMVKFFFPRARLLWVRLPGELSSYESGKALARAAASLGRDIRVLGSTDLTHYGPNYGFSPHGSGQKALDWVRCVNDRRFIEAVTGGKAEIVLARAETEKSACSAGAALGCLGFAGETGGGRARLLAYGASADIALAEGGQPPESFVGYGALCW
jgi:AmmeMemoRadiSam system protein B